jgi:uncharacterized protein
MDITPLIPEGRQIIQGYAHGRFRVSSRVYDGAVIVFPEATQNWDFTKTMMDLTPDDFAPLIAAAEQLDVVLVGCGAALTTMPLALRQALKDRGISVEFMDTGAACRTYNVLMAEGRRVAAALLPTEAT